MNLKILGPFMYIFHGRVQCECYPIAAVKLKSDYYIQDCTKDHEIMFKS